MAENEVSAEAVTEHNWATTVVTCETCHLFHRGLNHVGGGMGRCQTDAWRKGTSAIPGRTRQVPPWPMAQRYCDQWRRLELEP